MASLLACIAPSRRLARAAAAGIAARVPGVRVEAFSIGGFLAADGSPVRVVLCPAGRSVPDDLRFLRRAARRILWPPPPALIRNAVGGIRARHLNPRPEAALGRLTPATGRLAAALLLEGRVGADRAAAALSSPAPRDWIVESARHVLIPDRLLARLERAGVRWSVLDPVEVVALYARPLLSRARAQWKSLLPARTPVWIRAVRR